MIVAAAGNEHTLINDDFKVWPAELGGKPTARDSNSAVVITVGAHNAANSRAGFTNYGPKVDVFAPGCMIPSFELRRSGNGLTYAVPGRAVRAYVTGTSFAAPIVSFFVGLIFSDQNMVFPSSVKERILVGTDFYSKLTGDTWSSGVLNAGKILGHRFDIIEVDTASKRSVKYGKVTVKGSAESITCGDVAVTFRSLKKLAHDKDTHQV